MDNTSKQFNVLFTLCSLLFIGYTVWWCILNLFFSPNDYINNYFTDSYGIVAGLGGIAGYLISKKWGGFKSIFGGALSLISIGLFFQFLGQVSYAIYFYVYNIDNPYPSFGEIFYFGSIPIYIYGVILLGHAVGVKFNFKSLIKSPEVLLIPVAMLYFAYSTFLSEYAYDSEAWVASLLDLGYPIGQAIFVSLTAIVVINSRSQLGGIMKKYILFVLFAFVFQYFADTTFLYHTVNETWRAAGFDDFLFLVSYYWMGLSLYRFAEAANAISGNKPT